MELVEIVARIGDTVVDVAHLPPGARYCIGSGPAVDLAVGTLGSFPMIDGDVVRVPAGLVARVNGGRELGPTIPIAGTIELRIGLVELTICKIAREVSPVPRPRTERRPYVYLVASLILQVSLWLAAVTLAPFQPVIRPVHRIAKVTHVTTVTTLRPPPPPPAPKPAKAPAADAKGARAGAMKPRGEHREAGPTFTSAAEATAYLAKTMGNIHIAEKLAASDGPVDPNGAFDEQGFGGGGHQFDVDRVAPEQTYAVTRWALPTYFHRKGELAPVPSIELCDDDSCLVQGPRELHAILDQLIKHEAEIAMCYREHTGDLDGRIRIRFEISPLGKVTGTYGTADGPVGYGTGTVGRCVAKLAAGLHWAPAPDQARVFIGMAFRPA
jgi:hypothetical protein